MKRVQWMLALVALTLALGSAPAARAVVAEHFVPTSVPADWYVIGAQPASRQGGAAGFRFYSSGVGERAPALAVGTISCDGGCDQLEGRPRRVRGPRGADASIVRNGPYTWVTWADPGGQDVVDVLLARGLDDDEVVRAARATRGVTGSLRVARTGFPDGFRDRGSTPTGPGGVPSGAEHSTFLRATGGEVDLYAYRADAEDRAAQRFFAGQQPRMSHDFQRELAYRIDGDRVAVATGPDRDGLQRLVASVRPADGSAWAAFRARIHDIPTSVLLAGLEPGFTVLDGSTATTRWAAAFRSDGERITAYSKLVDVDTGRIAGSSFAPTVEPGTVVPLAMSWDGGPTQLLTGVVPAGTASVRFDGTGEPSVAVQPSSATRPNGDHYYAAVLPAAPVRAVVALDANGVELARAGV